MKGFYVIALVVVVALTLTPFILLEPRDSSRYEGKVVRFDTYGSPVRSVDPVTCGDTTSSTFVSNVFEGLYTYHFLKRPAHSSVIPLLAADDQAKPTDDGLWREKSGQKTFISPGPLFDEDRK